jgi:hypothetical protein
MAEALRLQRTLLLGACSASDRLRKNAQALHNLGPPRPLR